MPAVVVRTGNDSGDFIALDCTSILLNLDAIRFVMFFANDASVEMKHTNMLKSLIWLRETYINTFSL